jgi:energy-coupling factor transporter ATP-binding protein EcfA2
MLVDEPELNLHASLQLDFVTTLARATKWSVLFATHSMGLARSVSDRIYVVTKGPVSSLVRTYDASRDLKTLAGQLSFDGRPDLGFKRILLVEGKTEVRALAQLLRLYKKEHEILMLPLHGDDLIRGDSERELSEIVRLGAPISYLIDSEKNQKDELLAANRQDFVALCHELGITGHILERRALENYFTEFAIARAFPNVSLRPLGHFDRKPPWSKRDNWRIAAEMTIDDIAETDLGKFLATA